MNEESATTFRCSHYERNDWLKVDVNALLAPWVSRVAEIYRIGKTPAKYLTTYALAMVAVPHTQEILESALAVLDDPAIFQRRYGTRLVSPIPPQTSVLTNPHGVRPATPRQVNFMDLVDYWAVSLNRTFGIGIVHCRDVVKIVLTVFLADHPPLLSEAIQGLVQCPETNYLRGMVRSFSPISRSLSQINRCQLTACAVSIKRRHCHDFPQGQLSLPQ